MTRETLQKFAMAGVEAEIQSYQAKLTQLEMLRASLSRNGHIPAGKAKADRQWTAAQRKSVSLRMKRYWAERRKTR